MKDVMEHLRALGATERRVEGADSIGMEFRPTTRALWERVEEIGPQADGRWSVSSWSHGYWDIETSNLRMGPKGSPHLDDARIAELAADPALR